MSCQRWVTLITSTTASTSKNVPQFRHSSVGAGGGRAHRLLSPPPRAILGHIYHHQQHAVTNLLKLNTQHALMPE